VLLSWKLREPRRGLRLKVRPLVSGRDPHALHRENSAFRFDHGSPRPGWIRWRPYEGVPAVLVRSNAAYEHRPDWYRNFVYREERARGLDFTEDLATPGVFDWDLSAGECFLAFAAEGQELASYLAGTGGEVMFERIRDAEARRRARFPSPLHRAADAYLVRRGRGSTIIAGYPWFADWGRDTFIAIRGLCLATGRLEEAGAILEEWATAVSGGMLPNRFPDRGDVPEYNSVDASLWFGIAVHEYLEAVGRVRRRATASRERVLREAVEAILEGYSKGTRYGIRLDDDGLLAAGEPGTQLTWMDARVGDWTVTPRVGKPVEVQALWLNVLRASRRGSARWTGLFERGTASFAQRFWNPERGMLHDVVDVDHRPGTADPTFRPNQIFAVGGLPWSILDGDRARSVVDAVERELWTPIGLRSLAPGEPGYAPRYEGGVRERDGAYHQGTVWPWLIGPFVEAWVRVREGSLAVGRLARERFLEPLLDTHLRQAGLGHVSEIADADPPHAPRGCPFQAWSVGEALRLSLGVLAEEQPSRSRPMSTRESRPRRVSRPRPTQPLEKP
jgi:predicted glycogen debranching enzyme